MTDPAASQKTPPVDAETHVDELRERIELLVGEDEAAFGEFGRVDWVLCVLGSVVVPAAAAWWFAG